MKKLLLNSVLICLIIASCKKSSTDNNNSTNQNGDYLTKAVQVSPATGDTNILTLQWDASKRLIQYKSSGMVNGYVTNIVDNITRDASGKIVTISSSSTIAFGTDSSVSSVHYVSGTSKLSYAKTTRTSFFGNVHDSAVFTYNSAGQVTKKDVFSDYSGSMAPTTRETYVYDANGNITTVTGYNYDQGTSTYTQGSLSTYTYNSHKAMVTLGEEAYIIIGAQNVSKNENSGGTSNAVASGTTYTNVVSQQSYNSFDRPTSATFTISSATSSNVQKLTLYYQ